MSETADPSVVASSSSLPPNHAAPTLLTALHVLLSSSSSVLAPLDHPYAPSQSYGSWKGKSKELDPSDSLDGMDIGLEGQMRLLGELQNGMESARQVLGVCMKEEGKGEKLPQKVEEGRTKLARAMKDVPRITHQSSVLPLATSTRISQKRPPSFRTPPRPMELLTIISKRLGIETYLEESQFGLLKTTLAIAGKRFVLDVELEADSTSMGGDGEGEGEGEGEEMETPAPTPGGSFVTQLQPHPQLQPQPQSQEGGGDGGDARGKVRLAKLMVNHITKDGGTANSTHIANAIRQALDSYLGLWIADDQTMREREEEVDEVIRRLWGDMSDLASLDIMSESSGRDWFAELEERAMMVERLVQSGDLFASTAAVLPNFRITSTSSSQFRIRPAGSTENIPDPFSSSPSTQGASDWVVEYIPDSLPGLVVRRNWISRDLKGESILENEFHVEQLLCTPPDSQNGFPYTAEFVHTASKGGLEQRWSVVDPGPAGYLVGRVGLSEGEGGLKRLLTALCRQIVLNNLLSRVLDPSMLQIGSAAIDYREGEEDEDEDEDLDLDILSRTPIALPITLDISNNSLRAVMPLPHCDSPTRSTLTLTFSLREDGRQLQIEWECVPSPDDDMRRKIEQAVDAGREGGVDILVAVERIDRHLASTGR